LEWSRNFNLKIGFNRTDRPFCSGSYCIFEVVIENAAGQLVGVEVKAATTPQGDTQATKTLKGNRFLLLRNYHELPDDKKERLENLLTGIHHQCCSLVNKEQAKSYRIKRFATKPITKKESATLLSKVLDKD